MEGNDRNTFPQTLRTMNPNTWWNIVDLSGGDKAPFEWKDLKSDWLQLFDQLLSANATTAGLERVFSSYALIHSKLQNKLGNEQGKLEQGKLSSSTEL